MLRCSTISLTLANRIAGSVDDSSTNIRKLEQKEQQRILKPKPTRKR